MIVVSLSDRQMLFQEPFNMRTSKAQPLVKIPFFQFQHKKLRSNYILAPTAQGRIH